MLIETRFFRHLIKIKAGICAKKLPYIVYGSAYCAGLAQLVEHPPCKRTVVSSSLTAGSIF